jgi:hypothetical protein
MGKLRAPDSGKRSLQASPNGRGQPAETRPHALQNIVRSGKTLIVAPLIAGCYQSSTLIATGRYLAAIMCAGAAALAFLLLAISLELVDVFVDFMWKRHTTAKVNDENS